MTQASAEELLKSHGGANGLFVVWQPPTKKHDFMMSVCYAGMIFHNPCRCIGQGVTNAYGTFFSSIGYASTSLPSPHCLKTRLHD